MNNIRNPWVEESQVKAAAELIQTLLTDEFRDTIPNPPEWLSMIEELIDMLYSNDIVILDGLMRYEIDCRLDALGLVENIYFVKKV